jgi:flagellar protein FliS
MNPYRAYQQQQNVPGWTRIDMLLALFDGAIERLDKVLVLNRQGDLVQGKPLLDRTRLIVGALISGMDGSGSETQTNLLRLYEFSLHCIDQGDESSLTAARNTLATLREGFQGIRAEAVQLERSGEISPIDLLHNVHASA